MRCADVRDWLLAPEGTRPLALSQHLEICRECAAVEREVARLDAIVRPLLVVDPPPELSARLVALVDGAGVVSAAEPSRRPVRSLGPTYRLGAWVLAAAMGGMASWQVYGWAAALAGDVGHGLSVLTTSPALPSVQALGLDLPGLAAWTLVAATGWALAPGGRLRAVAARLARAV